MKKSIKEGSMSDIDLMAQEAVSFKDFVTEFYKEFRDFPKNRDAMKWLESTTLALLSRRQTNSKNVAT